MRAQQLRVSPLLAEPGFGQGGSLKAAGAPARLPASREGGHKGRVDCELHTVPKGKAVGDDFEPTIVDLVDHKVQISKAGIDGDPRASLSAHPGRSPLKWTPPAPQHPGPGASCAVIAQGVKAAMAPAEAVRNGEREAKTPKEKGAESVAGEGRLDGDRE